MPYGNLLRFVTCLLVLLAVHLAAAEPGEVFADDLTPATGASAQDLGEKKEQEAKEHKAKELFEKGNRDLERAARARGKQKEQLLQNALDSYFDCLTLVRNPNLIFNLALALEQIGRFGEAFDQYTDYLLFPGLTEQERAEASARREGLRPRVAVVSVHSDTPGATVHIDGLEAAPEGTPLVERAVDEGEHEVVVSRPEFQPFQASVVARAGDTTRLRVALEPLPIEPPESETEPIMAEEKPEPVTATVRSNVKATVTVDGENAGSGTKVKLTLDPGPHLVSVTAPGFQPAQTTLLGKPGQQKQLLATLAPKVEPGNRLAPWPTVALVATGVAGAVWLGLGVRALSLKGDYDSDPTEENADKVDRANLAADVGGLAMTAAFGATALVLTLLDGPRQQTPSRISLQAGALGNGVGLATRGVIYGL